ncbi:putative heme degradation protein [Xanthomonas sacchari]|uniref:hypothetical protein n=1 Tax=Xanthomonas sacchari TaxID=56458 RepID=UPI00278935F3|nr:hypothetical protein [Xanthomonas sacchari]MDQ1094198.1 putative heme degradation protein [Xanthomonas sacchari]
MITRTAHAVDDTATDSAPTPPARRAAISGRAAAHSVYRSPLAEAEVGDEALRLREQRTKRAAQVAAVGTVTALAAVALIAWRRARR